MFVHGSKSKVYIGLNATPNQPTNISNYVLNVQFPRSTDTAETSVVGNTVKSYCTGLSDGTFTIDMRFDPTVDQILSDLINNATVTRIWFEPQGQLLPHSWQRIETTAFIVSAQVTAGIGDISSVSAQFQATSAIMDGNYINDDTREMENSIGTWVPFANVSSGPAVTASSPYNGTYSGTFTASSTVSSIITGFVADDGRAVAGYTYRLGCYLKPSRTQSLKTYIGFYNSGNTLISAPAAANVMCTAGSWTRLAGDVVAPSTTAKLKAFIGSEGAIAGDIINFDEVTLHQKDI